MIEMKSFAFYLGLILAWIDCIVKFGYPPGFVGFVLIRIVSN